MQKPSRPLTPTASPAAAPVRQQRGKSNSGRRPTNAPLKACLECQKRKTRCVGGAPCAYCVRARKTCTFGAVPARTPLTRRNLDDAEERCRRLRRLLRERCPDVDLDLDVDGRRGGGADVSVGAENEDEEREKESRETTPGEEYEWHEPATLSPGRTPDDALNRPDGMATLVTSPHRSGFLGRTAGTSILQRVADVLGQSQSSTASPGDTASPASQSKVKDVRRYSSTSLDPLESRLVNLAFVDGLFTHYFAVYNSCYPVIHEPTFREQFRTRTTQPRNRSWTLIVYSVLAFGNWIRAGEDESSNEDDECQFTAAARGQLSLGILESGSLELVQGLLLLGNFLQKRDRPNTAYNYIGLACRIGLGLGLHRERPKHRSMSVFARERRSQIFWVMYAFESGFSFTTGRPPMFHDTSIDIGVPRNINEKLLGPDLPEPVTEEGPTIHSSIIGSSSLSLISNQIHQGLLNLMDRPSSPGPSMESASQLEQRLLDWRVSIPSYFFASDVPAWFRAPRAITLWKEQNVRMIMWWCMQKASSSPQAADEAGRRALRTALEAIRDTTNFATDHADLLNASVRWYLVYMLFRAALVVGLHQLEPRGHAHASHSSDEGTSFSAENDGMTQAQTAEELPYAAAMTRAKRSLAELGRKSKAASRCAAVLERISEHAQLGKRGVHGAQAADVSEADVGSGAAREDQQDADLASAPALMPTQQPSLPSLQGFAEYQQAPPFGNTFGHGGAAGDFAPFVAADPSLSMLLDTPMDGLLFQDFAGFPGTAEGESISYDMNDLI